MSVLKSSGKELGKLFRSLQETEFWMQQATGAIVGIYVRDKFGQLINADHKGKLHHGDKKIGDVYHCKNGYEYIHANGQTYHYNSATNSWIDATA